MSGLNAMPMFFMTAHRGEGTVSRFREVYSAEAGWRVYVLEGGHSMAKSLFLKRTAREISDAGSDVTLFPALDDPKSLDGIAVEDKGVLLVNGEALGDTARYPVVCETVLSFDACLDEAILMPFKPKIVEEMQSARSMRRRADKYFGAAAALLRDNMETELSCTDAAKVERYAGHLFARLLQAAPEADSAFGKTQQRFLSGVTPQGVVTYHSTVQKLCQRVYSFSDACGAVSDRILQLLAKKAEEVGIPAVRCPCPLLSGKTEHLLLPGLGVGFVSANRFLGEMECSRTVHARRFTDPQAMRAHRQRISFNRRAARELLDSGILLLSSAAAEVERVNGYYAAATDFDLVEEMRRDLLQKI